MKLKIVFVIVLLSLFLNIFHDFFIEHQVNIEVSTELDHTKIKKITSKHQILDQHEIFHFTALMSTHKDVEFFPKFLRAMVYLEKNPPQPLLSRSFKPPRA